MNNFDTSTWKKFKIGDVLDIRSSNGIFHANALNISEQPFEGSHPYVVRSSRNNGIRGYIKEDETALNPAKTISFAQDTAEMFYQEEAYFTGNNVKVASIKDGTPLNEMSALFIITALRKSMSAFHWGVSFELEKIKDMTIILPATETYEPDWSYMRERIAELERERIAELEQYLIATGLNDYELTEEDRQILATKLTDGGASQSSESGSGYWKEAKKFKLDELFDSETGNVDIKKDDIGSSGINVVSAGTGNCGIVGKTTLPSKTFSKDTITVDMFGNAFYQADEYAMVTHARVFNLIPKAKGMNEQSEQYLVSLLKWMPLVFGFNNMCSWSKIHEYEVLLPVLQTGQPDWDFMGKYIHAIKKEVIADVVKYKDEVITKTKAMVQQPSL